MNKNKIFPEPINDYYWQLTPGQKIARRVAIAFAAVSTFFFFFKILFL